jgi:hypothetical protein
MEAQQEAEVSGRLGGDRGGKTPGQIARAYGIDPNSVGLWRKITLERGPESFEPDGSSSELDRRIEELERSLGRKEVESALLFKRLLGPQRLSTEQKVALMQEVRVEYGLAPALVALNLARSTSHWHEVCGIQRWI